MLIRGCVFLRLAHYKILFILLDTNGSTIEAFELYITILMVWIGFVIELPFCQVIVGSFIADGKKSNSTTSKSGPSSAPTTQMLHFGAPLTTSSPTHGPSSESSDDNGSSPSPLNRDHGIYNNASQPIHGMNMYQLWASHNPHWRARAAGH